jgi:phosphohistidine phosphatase
MAKRLKDQKIKIDLLVSSPAKRANKTAKLFAEELELSKDNILIVKELYEASIDNFYKVVSHLQDKYDTVAIFSHNPGITDFVNTLTNVHVDNMPTCSVFAVSIDGDTWGKFKEATKSFLFFDYPKKINE